VVRLFFLVNDVDDSAIWRNQRNSALKKRDDIQGINEFFERIIANTSKKSTGTLACEAGLLKNYMGDLGED